ncbi:MAG: hypothetical protein CL623_07810 [Arcobacter sp.]|nr:hypothetical protein [Arcobacter sp.]|tara:strand:+ start:3935 stop:5413 length:1479 start_codon:yes stop_codon:yes gene_type:complete
MKKYFIDKNKKNIIISIAFFIIFAAATFIIITSKYNMLEKTINDTNISNLIDKIQSKIDYNHKFALEYSTSDEVYNFIENRTSDYIYKNFREGSYTLEDVDLSYFILTDKENNIKYSNFTRDIESIRRGNFSDFIVDQLKDTKKIKKIVIYENEAYYLCKTPIYKTDYENTSNGFLYLGSKIDEKAIKELSKGFKNIKFITNQEAHIQNDKSSKQETINLKIKVKSKIEDNININEISFYNHKSNLLFTIKVESEIELLNNTKELVLIIFLFLVSISIFTLLYISNKYKKELEEQYNSTDKIVEERTYEIKVAMKELEKVNKNLYDIAHTDFLTKTMNRRNFFIHAQNNFAIAQKNKQLLCVVMIDIDNFKKFNDKYGHSIGDKILVLFAQKIKKNISEKSIFGRLGGEEFALVISNTNLEDSIAKAEKLKKKIEEIELIVEGNALKVTASFGVSDNQNCSNIDEMLQKADKLLYTAKESGRNLVRSRLNFC